MLTGKFGVMGSVAVALGLFAWGTAATAVPSNDDFVNARVLTGSNVCVTSNNVGATIETDEPYYTGDESEGGAQDTTSVWFQWTASADGVARFSLHRSDFYSSFIVFEDNEGPGTAVNDLYWITSDSGEEIDREVDVSSGNTYWIRVAGYYGDVGNFDVGVQLFTTPENDNFVNALRIEGSSATVNGNNVNCQGDYTYGTEVFWNDYYVYNYSWGWHTTYYTVWYKWTAPSGGSVIVRIPESDFTPSVEVYTGTSVNDLSQVGEGYDSIWSFEAVADETYKIHVGGYGSDRGNFVLTLEHHPAPSNDDFSDATTISGGPEIIVSGSTYGATYQDIGEPLDDYDTDSLWYNWTPSANCRAHLYVESETGNTPALSVYTGDLVDDLTEVDWSTGQVDFNATAGTTYRIRVASYYGPGDYSFTSWVGDFTLRLTFDLPPANDGFTTAKVLTGATFRTAGILDGATRETGEPLGTFETSEGATVWYSWTAPTTGRIAVTTERSNAYYGYVYVYTGTAVDALTEVAYESRQNSRTVVFSTVAGTTYRISVIDPYYDGGSFQLASFAPPANDNRAGAEVLDGTWATAAGHNFMAGVEGDEPNNGTSDFYDPCGLSYATVWYSWTAPVSGPCSIWTQADDDNPSVFLYTVEGGIPTLLPPGEDEEEDSWDSSREFEAVAGTTYLISVDTYGGWGVPFTLSLMANPSNDDFADATVLTGSVVTAEGSNEGAGTEDGEPHHDPVEWNEASVWWRWTAPDSGEYTISTECSTFDTLLAVYTGDTVDCLMQVAQNDNSASGRTSTLVLSAVGGTTYHIAVDGFDESMGSIALSIHPGEFLAVAAETRAAQVTRLQVKLNFARDNADSILLSGILPIAEGFSASGADVSVDVGGVFRTFTLNERGASPPGNSTFKVKSIAGGTAQNVRFNAKFAKGDFLGDLSDDGFENATVTGMPLQVPVWIDLDGTVCETEVQVSYTAKEGKKGTANQK